MNKSANSVFITVTLLLIQASLILGQNGEKSVDLVMPGRTLLMVSKSENLLNALHVNKILKNLFTFVFISELYSNVKKFVKSLDSMDFLREITMCYSNFTSFYFH